MHDRKPTPIWMRNESGYSYPCVCVCLVCTNNSFKIHPGLTMPLLDGELIKMWSVLQQQ